MIIFVILKTTFMKQDIFLKDGTQLLTGFNRIVHGDRGDYMEFEHDHLSIKLISLFNNTLSEPTKYYYYWLYPIGHKDVKIYYQKRTVKYADYKVDKYYISPDYIKDYKDPETLF